MVLIIEKSGMKTPSSNLQLNNLNLFICEIQVVNAAPIYFSGQADKRSQFGGILRQSNLQKQSVHIRCQEKTDHRTLVMPSGE